MDYLPYPLNRLPPLTTGYPQIRSQILWTLLIARSEHGYFSYQGLGKRVKISPATAFAHATRRRGLVAFCPVIAGTGRTGLDRPYAQGRSPWTAPIGR